MVLDITSIYKYGKYLYINLAKLKKNIEPSIIFKYLFNKILLKYKLR